MPCVTVATFAPSCDVWIQDSALCPLCLDPLAYTASVLDVAVLSLGVSGGQYLGAVSRPVLCVGAFEEPHVYLAGTSLS